MGDGARIVGRTTATGESPALRRTAVLGFALLSLTAVGCGAGRPPASSISPVASRRALSLDASRPLARRGVAYGPYRSGQRPGGPSPSHEQLAEDLRIVASHWSLVRIYSSRGPAEDILRTVRTEALPLRIFLGIWLDPKDAAANADEIREACRLANAYRAEVAAVVVGNETQVAWSDHRLPTRVLLDALAAVRAAVGQPVATADDHQYWRLPESRAVAAASDFGLVHAHALWNGQPLDDAVGWTASTLAAVRQNHEGVPFMLGETGWATDVDPAGREMEHIHAPAGESEQARFYTAFEPWAANEALPVFLFEAFDEPWKGGASPREVEKHWGLFRVDRTPKPAVRELSR